MSHRMTLRDCFELGMSWDEASLTMGIPDDDNSDNGPYAKWAAWEDRAAFLDE